MALAPWVLTLIAFVLGLLSLTTAKQSAIGPYGLIQALPPSYFVALLILVAAFIWTWTNDNLRYGQFIVEAIALVVLLHGAPGIIESEPRFAPAWTIAGFTDYIAHTGHVIPVDARFSWPSFLTGTAFLDRAGGLPSSILVLRWWPVFINLMYLPPLFLLAKRILRDEKKAMLVVFIFPLANWVGQDYYSPQAAAYFLYLVFACLVLGPFGARRKAFLPFRVPFLQKRTRSRREREYQEDLEYPRGSEHTQDLEYQQDPEYQQELEHPQDRQLTRGNVVALLAAMLLIFSALSTGHQLTPYFAVVAIAGLAVLGRTRLMVWPVLLFLLATGWVCYGAIAFWAGHISQVFGNIGNVGGNLTANLTKRLRGSPAHYHVLDVRLAMFAVTWVAGLAGLWFGRKTKADRRAAAVLMLGPMLAVGSQPYGGEAGLRVFLFSLPGALCLAVLTLTAAARRMRPIIAGSVLVLMIPGFLVARWGNELSEMITSAEISGLRAVYAKVPEHSALLSINPPIPEFEDIGVHKYETGKQYLLDFAFSKSAAPIAGRLKKTHGNGYVVITHSELMYAWQTFGLSKNFGQEIARLLEATHRFRLVYHNSAVFAYEYIKTAHLHHGHHHVKPHKHVHRHKHRHKHAHGHKHAHPPAIGHRYAQERPMGPA